jgi:hypothetical protein
MINVFRRYFCKFIDGFPGFFLYHRTDGRVWAIIFRKNLSDMLRILTPSRFSLTPVALWRVNNSEQMYSKSYRFNNYLQTYSSSENICQTARLTVTQIHFNIISEELIKNSIQKYKLFAKVPESSINSWDSWFIFNLWKINTCYYTNVHRTLSDYCIV